MLLEIVFCRSVAPVRPPTSLAPTICTLAREPVSSHLNPAPAIMFCYDDYDSDSDRSAQWEDWEDQEWEPDEGKWKTGPKRGKWRDTVAGQTRAKVREKVKKRWANGLGAEDDYWDDDAPTMSSDDDDDLDDDIASENEEVSHHYSNYVNLLPHMQTAVSQRQGTGGSPAVLVPPQVLRRAHHGGAERPALVETLAQASRQTGQAQARPREV